MLSCFQNEEIFVQLDELSSCANISCLARHVLKVSDFQIPIESCSIESGNDSSHKSEVVHEKKFSLKNLLFNTSISMLSS